MLAALVAISVSFAEIAVVLSAMFVALVEMSPSLAVIAVVLSLMSDAF